MFAWDKAKEKAHLYYFNILFIMPYLCRIEEHITFSDLYPCTIYSLGTRLTFRVVVYQNLKAIPKCWIALIMLFNKKNELSEALIL